MASIAISDLRPTGSELFSDSESYMSELGDNELASVNGGITPTITIRALAMSKKKCLDLVVNADKYRQLSQAGLDILKPVLTLL